MKQRMESKYTTKVFASPVGCIHIVNEFLTDGTIYTELFVEFPGGSWSEVMTLHEAFEILELDYETHGPEIA